MRPAEAMHVTPLEKRDLNLTGLPSETLSCGSEVVGCYVRQHFMNTKSRSSHSGQQWMRRDVLPGTVKLPHISVREPDAAPSSAPGTSEIFVRTGRSSASILQQLPQTDLRKTPRE